MILFRKKGVAYIRLVVLELTQIGNMNDFIECNVTFPLFGALYLYLIVENNA